MDHRFVSGVFGILAHTFPLNMDGSHAQPYSSYVPPPLASLGFVDVRNGAPGVSLAVLGGDVTGCVASPPAQFVPKLFDTSSFSLREPYVVGPRGSTSPLEDTFLHSYDIVAGVKPGPVSGTTVVSAELEEGTDWGAFGVALY